MSMGHGSWLNQALYRRSAVLVPVAFFAERRASEVAARRVSDVRIDEPAPAGDVKARCQKNDQLGVGQFAHTVSLPA